MTDYLLRVREVLGIVKMSRTELYRQMGAGTFPRPVRLGQNTVRWRESDVQAWIARLNGEDPKPLPPEASPR